MLIFFSSTSIFCVATLETDTSTTHATGPNGTLGPKAKEMSNLPENMDVFHNINLYEVYWYLQTTVCISCTQTLTLQATSKKTGFC